MYYNPRYMEVFTYNENTDLDSEAYEYGSDSNSNIPPIDVTVFQSTQEPSRINSGAATNLDITFKISENTVKLNKETGILIE